MPAPAGSIARWLVARTHEWLDFALPQRCPGCGAPAEARDVLCASCRARIPRLDTPLCARCLVTERPPEACARHAGFRVHAAWIYDERTEAIVHAFKFGGRPEVARGLGAVLAAGVPAGWRRPDLIVPVPLHRARERDRGYNQAAHLADALADALGAPSSSRVMARRRDTEAQTRLGPSARRRNLTEAFDVRRSEWVRARRVLVVDDVITTGATLHAALAELKRAGAEAAAVALAWAP